MKKLMFILLISSCTISKLHCNENYDKDYIITIDKERFEINFDVDKSDLKTIASKRNNPGNLRPVGKSGFRYFKTLEDGYYALVKDITYKQTGRSSYLKPESTVRELIYVYAPPFENNSKNYVNLVCKELNIDKDTPIKDVCTLDLVRAIIKIEDYKLYSLMYNKVTYKKYIKRKDYEMLSL